MCNYMGHKVSLREFIRLKGIEKQFGILAALETLRSGFVYNNWEVIIPAENNTSFDTTLMHWEFIPPFIHDMQAMKEQRKKGIPWLNAKGENLFLSERGTRAMWYDAAINRRCLIPMAHFFEWRHFKPEGEKKDIAYPYVIEKADQDLFYAAGIWNPWTDKSTGETINTFAMVTTKANELMAVIHNKKLRQPTFLTEDLAWDWINKKLTKDEITAIGTYQMPSDEMAAYTLAKNFRESENPLEEYEYEELPPLDIAV